MKEKLSEKSPGLTKEEILEFLRKNKSFFKQEFDVDQIMLFGSYARDEATAESDIDILIKSKKRDFRKRRNLKIFLEKYLNKEVDVVFFDSIHPFIIQFIDKDLIYA